MTGTHKLKFHWDIPQSDHISQFKPWAKDYNCTGEARIPVICCEFHFFTSAS